ncbi:MAG: NAD(P)H-binding protein [Bacteroidia bacterium]|nr:NAD(P)H-binding protein [Bacteroidia bacterium]
MTDTGNKKTAVVFGATGLVGGELINELLEQKDFKVTAMTRRDLPVSHQDLVICNLDNFSQLMQLKDKLYAEVYFCCIGTTIKIAGSQEAFRKVDLEIPQQIAHLAESLSVQVLVIISSIGASPVSSNFYLRTKGEMEKTVREIYSGNLKFVRPSLLMGNRKEFRFGERASTVFMKAFGWLFTGPMRKYKGIYARDVARAMIKISRLPKDKVIFESGELQDVLRQVNT